MKYIVCFVGSRAVRCSGRFTRRVFAFNVAGVVASYGACDQDSLDSRLYVLIYRDFPRFVGVNVGASYANQASGAALSAACTIYFYGLLVGYQCCLYVDSAVHRISYVSVLCVVARSSAIAARSAFVQVSSGYI